MSKRNATDPLPSVHGCELNNTTRRRNEDCGLPATYFVTYFQDGGGGRYCCTQHLSKAIDLVLDTKPADSLGTAKVIRIGTKRPV